MSLQQIMTKIKAIRPFAVEDVLEQPRETLGGRMARQRNARADLKTLTESYRQGLMSSAVFILVVGDQRKEFIQAATEQFNFFSANADKFFEDIAGLIHGSLYVGKESSPGLLDVISRVMENKALEVGIVGYPMMTFRQEFRRVLKDRNDLSALIKEIITKQVGTEVVAAQAVKDILENALNSDHDAKTTPILLNVADENSMNDLIQGLSRITRRLAVVAAGATENSYSDAVGVASMSKKQVGMAMEILKAKINGGTPNLTAWEQLQEADEQEAMEKAALESVANMGAAETLIFQDEADLAAAAKAIESGALKIGETGLRELTDMEIGNDTVGGLTEVPKTEAVSVTTTPLENSAPRGRGRNSNKNKNQQ